MLIVLPLKSEPCIICFLSHKGKGVSDNRHGRIPMQDLCRLVDSHRADLFGTVQRFAEGLSGATTSSVNSVLSELPHLVMNWQRLTQGAS